MAKKGSTAYGAAFVRAMEQFVPGRLFEDRFVLRLLPWPARAALRFGWLRERFASMMEGFAPGIRGALVCRTRAIDEAVVAAVARGIEMVVILGAGLDTRAWRLPELSKTQVIELDLPAVQDFKKARITAPNVRFVPIDFDREGLQAALDRAGLNKTSRAVFVWEGVTQYLEPQSVDAVLKTVASSAGGSELVFTYVLEEVITGKFSPDRSEEFRKSASRQPEEWKFGIDPRRLGSFLAERGLTLRDDCGAAEHIARYLQPIGRTLAVSQIERVAAAEV